MEPAAGDFKKLIATGNKLLRVTMAAILQSISSCRRRFVPRRKDGGDAFAAMPRVDLRGPVGGDGCPLGPDTSAVCGSNPASAAKPLICGHRVVLEVARNFSFQLLSLA